MRAAVIHLSVKNMFSRKYPLVFVAALAAVGVADATVLFSSNFDGHDVAVDPSYVKDNTGAATASVTWTKDASVTAISQLTAVSGGGGFINQGTSHSDGDNLKVNYNLSNNTDQGFSMTFTLDASADLSDLSVVAAHANGTGTGQSYDSTLTYALSGGTLGSPVTDSSVETYASVFKTINFDLSGTTLGAGNYTLQVDMSNLSAGGAYAVFDGVTLSTVSAPNTLQAGTAPSGGFIENTSGATSNTLVASGNSKGQSFTLAGDTDMTGFSLDVNAVTTLSDLTVEIYAASADVPTGGALFSFTGTLPAGLVAGDWLECSFSSPLELSAGDYVILFSTTSSDLRFEVNGSDAYTGGRLVKDQGSGWVTANASDDFIFSFAGTMEDPNARTPSTGPNIVFIMVDDLGWTDHSASNLAGGNQSDFIQTPHMARLASEGLTFTSTYAQPNCAPSRAAFYTGQYSCRTANGVYNVASLDRAGGSRTTYTTPANQGDALIVDSADSTTIAEALYDAGYVTAHFGKFHIGTNPINQGYEYNYGGGATGDPSNFFASGGVNSEFAGPVGVELDPFAADYTQAYIDDNLDAVANGNNPDTLLNTPKHLTDAMGDAFESFMDAHRSGPMSNFPVYVQFNMYAPHTPIQPRPDLEAKYNGLPAGTVHSNAAYAGLVEGMDQTLGRVLNYLDDPNGDGDLSDSMVSNTLVIFTSDNGGVIGVTSNAPLRGHKGMHYEGGLRVPMVVRMPGTVPANEVTDTMVHVADFYPTLLDASSATYPNSTLHPLDGESFWSHSLDPDNVARSRSPIFYHFPGYMDNRTYNCSAVIAEVDGTRYKYIYNYDPYYDAQSGEVWGADQYQLYNLNDDLSETSNLLDFIDIENAGGPNDPSTSNEYWDYILNIEVGQQLAGLLNDWLVGDPDDATWNPIYSTYKSTYPNLDPALIGTETGPAPATIPVEDVQVDEPFKVEEQSFPNSSTFRVRFNSESGYSFQVQKRESLTSGDWLDEGAPVVASSAVTEIDVTVDTTTTPNCFYRVSVLAR